MAIELDVTDITAYSQHVGWQEFELAQGKSFKIETTPDGEDILDVSVPENKVWTVMVHVKIIETDIPEE